MFTPIFVWLAIVLVVDRGRWQHEIWNIVADVVIAFVVIPGSAALERALKREDYRQAQHRVGERWSRDWPIYFWTGVIAIGIALLATGFVGQGVAVLVIPALVFTWARLRKVTVDPWK
jgi:hypothetical protein